MADRSAVLQNQVQQAISDRIMLRIVGGNSKAFLGNPVRHDDILETRVHQGIINYQPEELFITARAGTSLQEIEQVLAEKNQMLAFEPPHFGPHATLGGAVACGLSGPRRPFAGAVRDHLLGSRVLNGKGELLSFGGEVIKNVAGYDVSRLMSGAMGTLGVLLDISLRVAPRPQQEVTLCLALSRQEALHFLVRQMQTRLPLSAACHLGDKLYIRLSGHPRAIDDAIKQLNGETVMNGDFFWQQCREQQQRFFTQHSGSLWRMSLPLNTLLTIEEECLMDWAGAQNWFFSDRPANQIRQQAEDLGGHAVLFRSDETIERFHPLSARLRQFHLNLREVFDPYGILNYGRLYSDL